MHSGPAARRIVIIGSGFGGLGLGCLLKARGIESFTILEKAADLGGTWRENTYPGAACDVPSILYCLSFAQKTDWSRKWSPSAEIHQYMEDVAHRHGLLPHLRFGVEVAGARFDEATSTWTVRSTTGETFVADVLVSGVGQLHRPNVPSIPGMETFAGARFHSATWDHRAALTGRRVGVVGNAASAIQFIPPLAAQAGQLTIFQRSANWMIPRRDHVYGPVKHWLFAHLPVLTWLYRAWLWARGELLLYPVMRRAAWSCRFFSWSALHYMRSVVNDPALRRVLTPDYPIGGKRILISDDYYQSLTRPHVRVETSPIVRIVPSGVVTADGRTHELDALVLATGFRTNPFLAPMEIEGIGGRRLAEAWRAGAHAYYGLTVSGFPNFFMLYGPNTNLGHNSIIFMLECQFAYILGALDLLDATAARRLEVRPEVMDAYNRDIQGALSGSAWASVGDSWYKDAEGRITNNWPYSTAWYWWKTRRIRPDDYQLSAASSR